MILLLIVTIAAVMSISCTAADTGITITAQGDRSYYLGEEVILSGNNSGSEYTYLLITGPDLPANGGRLTAPNKTVVSGDDDSFDRVMTKQDKTWEYTFYTGNIGLKPGPYTISAAGEPKAMGQIKAEEAVSVSVILKQPFITTGITPRSVTRGLPFNITGYAEGEPAAVQIWIFGENYAFSQRVPVDQNSTYMINAGAQVSGQLPEGTCYLIAQHPMQNNQPDIVVDGDWVKGIRPGNGSSTEATNLFRVKGAGSLQGRDAKEALIAALTDPSIDDTYAMTPFTVDDAGIPAMPEQKSVATIPQGQPEPAPLQYAPAGALVLVIGLAIRGRQ